MPSLLPRFQIAPAAKRPQKACMFALGGDAFPNDTDSLCEALSRGAEPFGASADCVRVSGNFPSIEKLEMNLTGVRLDAMGGTKAEKATPGGFFARTIAISAEPARVASVPVHVRLHAEDCVFAFGTTANAARVTSLERCTKGVFNASAATVDIEAALLSLARDAASEHGAEVQSVRLTLAATDERTLEATAVAVAKAMFFTATLTIRGRLTLDAALTLRFENVTCTGDGMIANLAAAQLRPRLAELAMRPVSIRALLPDGVQPDTLTLSAGASIGIAASFGQWIKTS